MPQPSIQRIDFAAVNLPEYKSCHAWIMDGLFTDKELSRYLAAAEASAEWEPAKVNVTADYAVLNTSYRKGERIILDDMDLSSEMFSKIRPHLHEIEEIQIRARKRGQVKKKMVLFQVRMNERLRFLRYHPGDFFAAHCDGSYITPDMKQETFYTVQLYLPSSVDGPSELPVGGTTRFLSYNGRAYSDVEPIPGRVLVFQHDKLLHTGEIVIKGTKCTVRSDILFEDA
ncbi:oxidoreductase domain-containing protein [Mycena floridula]|nr:oxidoreductase domain-containing protein [Mycena floridula]